MSYFSRPVSIAASAVFALLVTGLGTVALAQGAKPIDFNGLSRATGTGSKSFPIKGIGAESNRMLSDFMEADGMERSEIAARSQSSPPSSSTSNSGVAGSGTPRTSSSSTAGETYACQYQCTNAKFSGSDKTTLTIRVKAGSESAARDETHKHARATCYEQTRRVYDTGSASCRKQ